MKPFTVIDGGRASTRPIHADAIESLDAALRALAAGRTGAAATWVIEASTSLRADCPCGIAGAGHGGADHDALAVPKRVAA